MLQGVKILYWMLGLILLLRFIILNDITRYCDIIEIL